MQTYIQIYITSKYYLLSLFIIVSFIYANITSNPQLEGLGLEVEEELMFKWI